VSVDAAGAADDAATATATDAGARADAATSDAAACSTIAIGEEFSYFSPTLLFETGGAYLVSPDTQAIEEPALGAAAPTMNIVQWNIVDALQPTAVPPGSCGNALWGASNSWGRVCGFAGTSNAADQVIELAQEGTGSELACPLEFDMFIHPTADNYADHGYPRGMLSTACSPSLSELSELRSKQRIQFKYFAQGRRCANAATQCESSQPDYGYMVLGLWLHNATAGMSIDYQVQLWDSRQSTSCARDNPCLSAKYKYFPNTATSMVLSEPIANYGVDCMATTPTWRSYDIDVLPHISALLTDTADPQLSGVDHDLSHWKLSAAFLGTGLNGAVSITTQYDSWSITGKRSK
jgi:hypothetical protein